MKFAQLQTLGRELSDAELTATLRQLCAEPRFAAVVRLMEQQKELAANASAQLKFAEHPGCLAHAAGVRYGLLELEGRLRQACAEKKAKG